MIIEFINARGTVEESAVSIDLRKYNPTHVVLYGLQNELGFYRLHMKNIDNQSFDKFEFKTLHEATKIHDSIVSFMRNHQRQEAPKQFFKQSNIEFDYPVDFPVSNNLK